MDLTPFTPHLLTSLTWFIHPIVLLTLLNSPWAKGHIGEWQVRLFAGWRLDEPTYRSLHNVTLDTPGRRGCSAYPKCRITQAL